MAYKSGMKTLQSRHIAPLSGKADSLVIFLHGYGANGADLLSIGHQWRPVLPNTVFAAPDAPDVCEVFAGGFQWFGLRAQDGPLTKEGLDRKDVIQKPAAILNAYLDEQLAEWGLTEDRLVVAGFSQGAMMTMYTMPRRKTPCAAIIGWSGMLIDAEGLTGSAVVKMPVLATHGEEDMVVPPDCLAAVDAGFSAAGFEVETIMRPDLPHGIDEFTLTRSVEFAREHLEKSGGEVARKAQV